MASRQQQQQPAIFTLPSNASLELYPENTTTDYRVELPARVELRGHDYEVALASFTYPRTWYNVVTARPYTATLTYEPDHGHGGGDSSAASCMRGDVPPTVRSGLVPGHYGTLDEILTALNRDSGRLGIRFKRQGPGGPVAVHFKEQGLEACAGRVTLTPALAWLLGWPDRETVLVGYGGSSVRAPSQPRLEPVDCLYVHCDLAQDAHVVGNVKNCLLRAIPTRGQFGEVVCYEPRLLDWLPVRWTEFKHLHVVITDGYGARVPFEGGTCSVKLLLRRGRGLI